MQIRNLSRAIWVQVGIPPAGIPAPTVPTTKGKTTSNITTEDQLRRRKIDVLRLCVAFAIATKHYLRDEDGTHWEDLLEVLPASFARYDGEGYNTLKSSITSTKTVTEPMSRPHSQDEDSKSSPSSPVASKRVRPKRSKTKVPGSSTPLLHDSHRSVDFKEHSTMPLPLMQVSNTVLSLSQCF